MRSTLAPTGSYSYSPESTISSAPGSSERSILLAPVRSLVPTGQRPASTIACVPHSARYAARTRGKAAGPRWLPYRPKAAAFSGVYGKMREDAHSDNQQHRGKGMGLALSLFFRVVDCEHCFDVLGRHDPADRPQGQWASKLAFGRNLAYPKSHGAVPRLALRLALQGGSHAAGEMPCK